jgi:hypothetical protein
MNEWLADGRARCFDWEAIKSREVYERLIDDGLFHFDMEARAGMVNWKVSGSIAFKSNDGNQ